MTSLRLSTAHPSTAKSDALVVFVHPRKSGAVLAAGTSVPKPVASKLLKLLRIASPKIAASEVVVCPSPEAVSADLVVFTCTPAEPDTEAMRRAAGNALRALSDRSTVAIACPSTEPEQIAAIGQGARLGAYQFTSFRGSGDRDSRTGTDEILLLVSDARSKSVQSEVKKSEIITNAVLQKMSGDSAAPTEAAAYSAVPARIGPRRPKRSAKRPRTLPSGSMSSASANSLAKASAASSAWARVRSIRQDSSG